MIAYFKNMDLQFNFDTTLKNGSETTSHQISDEFWSKIFLGIHRLVEK